MRASDVLGTGLFDVEQAQQAPGWVRELNGDHVPETEEYGISSTLFRADRPFHPGRLWHLITERFDSGEFGTVLRSKGFFTLAGRPGVTGLWSQAGSVARFEPAGISEAGTPGQRAQELVFIGTELEPAALHSALEDCLLDGEWSGGEDPFPVWDVPEAHEACSHEQHGVGLPV